MIDSPVSSVTTSPSAPADTLDSLVQAHNSLRTAFHWTLVLLLLLTATLFVFFLREASLARRQVVDLTQVVADFNKTGFPLIEGLRTNLHAYSLQHPDFAPIYVKYFGNANAAPAGAAPGRAQPAPGSGPVRLPPAGNR